jgi:hypothetical protein
MAGTPQSIEEEAELYSKWDRGTFPTVEESVSYHHVKHGHGLSRWEYLRKSVSFNRDGATRIDRGTDVKFSRADGEFLIEAGGKIVSYGPPWS